MKNLISAGRWIRKNKNNCLSLPLTLTRIVKSVHRDVSLNQLMCESDVETRKLETHEISLHVSESQWSVEIDQKFDFLCVADVVNHFDNY